MMIKLKLLALTFFLFAATNGNAALVPSEIEAGAKLLGANLVNEVRFDEGKSTLTPKAKADLAAFVNDAKKKGQIEEIKIAAWADKDYPNDNAKSSPQDLKLSAARAKELKEYLNHELGVNTVNTYNMSERPNPLQKAIGFAPQSDDGGFESSGYIFTRVQKSKALLMIYLQ